MATINSTSDTNNVNELLMRTGLRILRYTDRAVGGNPGARTALRGGLLGRLGSGILLQEATRTNPFTLQTS